MDVDLNEIFNYVMNTEEENVKDIRENICPECSGTNLATVESYLTCMDCGQSSNDLVIGTDYETEIAQNTTQQGSRPVGKKWMTSIMFTGLNQESMVMYNFKNYINNIFEQNLPCRLVDEATQLFKEFRDNGKRKNIIRKQKKIAAFAVSVYLTCLNNKIYRPQKEFPKIFKVESKVFNTVLRHFSKEMNITSYMDVVPENYLNNIFDRLYITDNKVRNIIRDVLKVAEKLKIIRFTAPICYAASVVFMVLLDLKYDQKVLLKELVKICFISRHIIIKTSNTLIEDKNLIYNVIYDKKIKEKMLKQYDE